MVSTGLEGSRLQPAHAHSCIDLVQAKCNVVPLFPRHVCAFSASKEVSRAKPFC